MSEESAESKTSPAAPATVLYIYAGVRRTDKNKPTYVYFETSSPTAEPQADASGFYSKKLYPAPIGTVLQFNRSEKGVFTSTATYIGRYENRAQLDSWAVAEARDKGLLELSRASKVDSRLAEILAPISKEYARTNPQGRAALITKVILTIQRQNLAD